MVSVPTDDTDGCKVPTEALTTGLIFLAASGIPIVAAGGIIGCSAFLAVKSETNLTK